MGVTIEHAVDSAIAFTPLEGLAIDSTWRRLTVHGCPMTLLLTVDENHRSVPRESWVHDFLCQDRC